MAKISYDGQSFSLDGQRIWLVSGAMHYPRIPRGLWRDRIRAAKQAGLNCIETCAFWNAHEPAPGEFDFSDNLDVRHFVELIAEEGMYCILRPGPYVCAEWENGGLPAWLHAVKPDRRSGPMRLREGNGPFLSAASRYLSALLGQVEDLQVTSPLVGGRPRKTPTVNRAGAAAGGFVGQGGGPIVLMQVENEWFCGNDAQDDLYHQQLIRLMREAGANVPLTVCNQLWQTVDGTVHTWNTSWNLLADMRQLRTVQPQAPRLVSEYWTGWFDRWGGPHSNVVDAATHLQRMVSIFAAGAQMNLYMFHGGTNFGFTSGRTIGVPSNFITTSYDYDAPLAEAGAREPKFDVTKRAALFASQFGSVFAHLDPNLHPAAVAPEQPTGGVSVIHLPGSRGDVVTLIRGTQSKNKAVPLLLPNGLSLPVTLGAEGVAWLLLDTRLQGGSTLDYTNLSPLAYLDGKLLVLCGTAGSTGLISIDGAHTEVKVPGGKTPLVETIEGTHLLILNHDMADASYMTEQHWVVGAAGIDAAGDPLPRRGWPQQTKVSIDGEIKQSKASLIRRPTPPKLEGWRTKAMDPLIDGTSEAYQTIKEPTPFDKLEHPWGYGWYRVRLPKPAGRTTGKVVVPGMADRLHIFRDGSLQCLIGDGPGGNGFDPVSLKTGDGFVALADNLGRFNYGLNVGEWKGIWSDLYTVKAAKLPKPERRKQPSPDPFELRGFVPQRRRGDTAPSEAMVYRIKSGDSQPLILDVVGLPHDAVIKVNDEPVDLWANEDCSGFKRMLLDPADDGPFKLGVNEIELAFYQPLPEDLDVSQHLVLHQATANLTASAEWAFTPWTQADADDEDWQTLSKATSRTALPRWYGVSFRVSSDRCPLFVDLGSMSKGQLLLNGRNVGRYFTQTRDGKRVPPQTRYYLPEPWLDLDGDNQLLLFDEHGFDPSKVKLLYDDSGPYG